MPELPEAETIVRELRTRIPGGTVTRVVVTHADVLHTGLSPAELGRRLRGRTVTDVSRRGKNVVIEFDGGVRLVINLGMTGRVVTSDAPRSGEAETGRPRQRRVAIGFGYQPEGNEGLGQRHALLPRMLLGDVQVIPADEPSLEQDIGEAAGGR
jgi:formamidopyrimidine-DNA glycosylase